MRRNVLAGLLVILCPSLGSAQVASGDEWLRRPVDDQTFTGYLQLFAYDRSLPLASVTGARDMFEGVSREHVTYQSTPGVRVTSRVYRASGGTAATPWLIFLHGGGGAGKDVPGYALTSAFMARAGWNVLAMDLQYFGERRTDLLTTYQEQEKHARLYNNQATYLAWIAQSVKDVGRAVDYLVTERGADPARISLVGFSRGAQVALIAGAAEKRLRAVVVLYGGHFDYYESGHLPAACPANYIGRISPRPLLLVNGRQDEDFIRIPSVEPMHRLARQPRQIIWLDTGHQLPGEDAMASVMKWLAANGQ